MKCPYINPTISQCENCPLPDCVNDDLSLVEYQEDVISEEVPKEVKMNRIRYNRYAMKHRTENRERSNKHYQANKDKYKQQAIEWQKENRDRTNAAARERYNKNIEERRQYLREWRARKKEERQAV